MWSAGAEPSRFARGLLLLAALALSVFAFTELFPRAHGQSEAELRANPFARLSVPDSVRLIRSEYRPSEWYGTGFGLLSGPPQVRCARVMNVYAAPSPELVRDAFLQAAERAGIGEAVGRQAVLPSGAPITYGTTAIHYSGGQEPRDGVTYTYIDVVDLPEPLGGHCTGGRLGIYPTLMGY